MNINFRNILQARNFVVLDTETTGLERPAEIIEIAILDPDGRTLLNTLIKPVRPIPPFIVEFTGISNEQVAQSPTWTEVRPIVLERLYQKDVIVYNAKYDRQLMHWTDEAHNFGHVDYKADATWHCAMEAYAEYHGEVNPYYGSYRWQKLTAAMSQMGIKPVNAHRALGDALMTLLLVKECVSRLPNDL